jgi:hypothetical protein
MTTGPHSSDERTEGGRAWLGGDRSTEGSERLARLFQIGRAERTLHAEKELAELMRRVRTLETELRALRRLDESDPYQAETSGISTVELRRPPEPGERDYELNRCQGFEVYAGQERLGIVEEILYRSRSDRPDVLEVRTGRYGRRHPRFVPVEDVEAIEPDEAAVIVREALRSSASRGRLAAAVARLRSPLVHG